MKNYLRIFAVTIAMVITLFNVNSFAADEPKYSERTSMAVILDNPAARAVITRYIPDVMADPQIEQARVISLGELATYIPAELNREVMTRLLADLNALEE